jgi:hypothetical protein
LVAFSATCASADSSAARLTLSSRRLDETTALVEFSDDDGRPTLSFYARARRCSFCTRGAWPHDLGSAAKIEIDPETYDARAHGERLVWELADSDFLL